MNQSRSLPALTPDEVRVHAWAEVRELLELQLAPLGRRALQALAPNPGENILDIGCGGGETALDLARAVAPDGKVVGSICRLRCWRLRNARLTGANECGSSMRTHKYSLSNRLVRRRFFAVWGDVLHRPRGGVQQHPS